MIGSLKREKLLNKKLLYIDNSFISINKTKAFCSATNMSCDLAQDCYTGIEKSKKSDYDFIIIHINMPCMNGYEIAKEIMKKKKVGTIFFTSGEALEWIDSDLVNESNFIDKTLHINDFFNLLEKTLE